MNIFPRSLLTGKLPGSGVPPNHVLPSPGLWFRFCSVNKMFCDQNTPKLKAIKHYFRQGHFENANKISNASFFHVIETSQAWGMVTCLFKEGMSARRIWPHKSRHCAAWEVHRGLQPCPGTQRTLSLWATLLLVESTQSTLSQLPGKQQRGETCCMLHQARHPKGTELSNSRQQVPLYDG